MKLGQEEWVADLIHAGELIHSRVSCSHRQEINTFQNNS